jgi:hypothetical protein
LSNPDASASGILFIVVWFSKVGFFVRAKVDGLKDRGMEEDDGFGFWIPWSGSPPSLAWLRDWLTRPGFCKHLRAVFRSIPLLIALIETLPVR